MQKKLFQLAMLSGLFGGHMPEIKLSAKDRKVTTDKHYSPPRSMTAEELEHYKKHKNLNGFIK